MWGDTCPPQWGDICPPQLSNHHVPGENPQVLGRLMGPRLLPSFQALPRKVRIELPEEKVH